MQVIFHIVSKHSEKSFYVPLHQTIQNKHPLSPPKFYHKAEYRTREIVRQVLEYGLSAEAGKDLSNADSA